MHQYTCALDLIHNTSPSQPVIILRPKSAKKATDWFLKNFPGKTLYALKANNNPVIVNALYESGIRNFDVASLSEIEQASAYDDAVLYLMNTVKSRRLISEAYHKYGVRNFALDSLEELKKICQETGHAKDLNLFVRLSCSSKGAKIALDNKFGCGEEEAIDLLMATRKIATRLGITFHVGSQSMLPERYSEAMEGISALVAKSGVLPDIIDVGGGFPSIYPDMVPPSLDNYISVIDKAFECMKVVETCELLCEPGRALVAEAGSTLVKVEQRRERYLYINDGAYGTLHDAAHYNFNYPARLIREIDGPLGSLQPFSLYGPTCDSADYMPGPFHLPSCVNEGDYIEIGQLGAYGEVMKTDFNGFGTYAYAILNDEPILSMYEIDENNGLIFEQNVLES